MELNFSSKYFMDMKMSQVQKIFGNKMIQDWTAQKR